MRGCLASSACAGERAGCKRASTGESNGLFRYTLSACGASCTSAGFVPRRLEPGFLPRRLLVVAAAVALAAMGMMSLGRVLGTLSGLGTALLH